ncbi:MAG TPA: hypothetical protein VG206_17675 [Terriglobia bacterium]|nr:hypothetical protein [Terriglobia bacterium]
MTTVDSTATLLEARTAPPADGTDLMMSTTGEAAPRDGKNLVLQIDLDRDSVKVHCQDTEHVGTHKQRCVLFSANKHCWLIFTPQSVFTEDYVELQEGETARAHVLDETKQAQTHFVVRAPKTAKAAKMGKMAKTAMDAKRPPVIVVP